MMLQPLEKYRAALENELADLLEWWSKYTIDEQRGGFYGKVDNVNQAHQAPKGLVLNARILYTFSAAHLLKHNEQYLSLAKRAYHYLLDNFYDKTYGGFYWSLNTDGTLLDGKKQVYGQAFAIYALSEYYKATNNEQALEVAKSTYQLLEKYSYDQTYTGYIEAHTQTWGSIDDLRLSEKDQNEKKSMNTHLHVVEAYANLYTIWQHQSLKEAIQRLLHNFKSHIIATETSHLHLFFTENWEVRSSVVSFGHDIEAAWLLYEAAEIIGNEEELGYFKKTALNMAVAAGRGLQENGGLLYEYDLKTGHWQKEYHWWPQAEAMVGFFNAWQLSGKQHYLAQSIGSWEFVKKHIRNKQYGEWYWGVDEHLNPMNGEDKAGFWKCPYHNGRACIELIKRIDATINKITE